MKQYIKPETEISTIKAEALLQSTSPGGIPVKDNPATPNSPVLGKDRMPAEENSYGNLW